MILKTWFPIETLTFHLYNNPRMSNKITVKMGGEKKTITLARNQWGSLTLSPKRVFRMKYNHVYRITIKAEKGAIPYFEERDNLERRHLGVFFKLDITRKAQNTR